MLHDLLFSFFLDDPVYVAIIVIVANIVTVAANMLPSLPPIVCGQYAREGSVVYPSVPAYRYISSWPIFPARTTMGNNRDWRTDLLTFPKIFVCIDIISQYEWVVVLIPIWYSYQSTGRIVGWSIFVNRFTKCIYQLIYMTRLSTQKIFKRRWRNCSWMGRESWKNNL